MKNTKKIGLENKVFLAHNNQNTKLTEQRKNVKISKEKKAK